MKFKLCSSVLDTASLSWYNEIKDYSYANPIFGMTTGHFTQLVWKGTKSVGFGVSVSSTGSVYGKLTNIIISYLARITRYRPKRLIAKQSF